MRPFFSLIACAAIGLIAPQVHALEIPAPALIRAAPASESEVPAPVSEIALTFSTEVDLFEIVVITPDQSRIVLHDSFNRGDERKGSSFTLALPEPLSLPGSYTVEISASVFDPRDKSASSLSTYSTFVIASGDAPPQ